MKKSRLLIGGLLVVVLIGGAGLGIFLSRPKPYITKAQLKSAGFPVYAARKAGGYNFVATSVNITKEDEDTLLKFDMVSPINKIVITEQAYPDVIIPDQFFAGLNEYDEFSSSIGKVVLAKPKDNGGKQTAVLTPNNTTMIFANPEKELTKDEWKALLGEFEVVK